MVEGVFKAAKEAGHQIVKEGRISEDTQKAVSKTLMPRDAYYKAAQAMMEQMKKAQWGNIDKGQKPGSHLNFNHPPCACRHILAGLCRGSPDLFIVHCPSCVADFS